MRTNRPAGHAMPSAEAFEEPQVISIDVDPSYPGPDNPGPDYGDPEEASELMEEEVRSQAAQGGAGSPPYTAPGDEPSQGGPSTTRCYYAEASNNTQVGRVFSSTAQVAETRKRSQEDGQDGARGTRCRRTGSDGLRKPRARSMDSGDGQEEQEGVKDCWCSKCEIDPDDSRRAAVDPTEASRRRMKVASTWTPMRRSRDNSAERERSRSASPREWHSSRMKEIRSQLLQETIRQVRQESRALEKAKQEFI